MLDAALNSWKVFNDAKLDPPNPENMPALMLTSIGEALDLGVTAILNYRAAGYRSTTNPSAPAFMELPDPSSVVISSDGRSASVEVCELNSNILTEAATGTILNDETAMYIINLNFELVGETWLLSSQAALQEIPGATTCPESVRQ